MLPTQSQMLVSCQQSGWVTVPVPRQGARHCQITHFPMNHTEGTAAMRRNGLALGSWQTYVLSWVIPHFVLSLCAYTWG